MTKLVFVDPNPPAPTPVQYGREKLPALAPPEPGLLAIKDRDDRERSPRGKDKVRKEPKQVRLYLTSFPTSLDAESLRKWLSWFPASACKPAGENHSLDLATWCRDVLPRERAEGGRSKHHMARFGKGFSRATNRP